MNLTKYDIIQDASHRTGISQIECRETFDAFIRELKHQLEIGNTLCIRDMFTLYSKERKARPAMNIREKTIMEIPARRVAICRFSKTVSKRINVTPAAPGREGM